MILTKSRHEWGCPTLIHVFSTHTVIRSISPTVLNAPKQCQSSLHFRVTWNSCKMDLGVVMWSQNSCFTDFQFFCYIVSMETSIILKITFNRTSILFQKLMLFSHRSDQEKFGKTPVENARYGPEKNYRTTYETSKEYSTISEKWQKAITWHWVRYRMAFNHIFNTFQSVCILYRHCSLQSIFCT